MRYALQWRSTGEWLQELQSGCAMWTADESERKLYRNGGEAMRVRDSMWSREHVRVVQVVLPS